MRRLETLEQEEKDGYSHTNLAWQGVVAGLIIGAAGLYGKSWKVAATGAALGGGSAIGGIIARPGENHRAKERREERDTIQKRLNPHHHRS